MTDEEMLSKINNRIIFLGQELQGLGDSPEDMQRRAEISKEINDLAIMKEDLLNSPEQNPPQTFRVHPKDIRPPLPGRGQFRTIPRQPRPQPRRDPNDIPIVPWIGVPAPEPGQLGDASFFDPSQNAVFGNEKIASLESLGRPVKGTLMKIPMNVQAKKLPSIKIPSIKIPKFNFSLNAGKKRRKR